jgi:hypothetical protein
MSVAYDARDFPAGDGLPPDVQEFESPAIILSVLDMTEPVAADFDRTMVFDGVEFEGPRYDVSRNAFGSRTTRSIHLADAGERLYAALRPALDEV